MQYHDPNRPKLTNGVLQYTDGNGQGIGALRGIEVEPIEDGDWSLGVNLIISPNCATWHYCTCTTEGLPSVLQRFREDPEKFFAEVFNHHYDPSKKAAVAAPKAKATLSLDDLE